MNMQITQGFHFYSRFRLLNKRFLGRGASIFSDNSSDEGLPLFKIKKNDIINKNISDLILIIKLESSKSEIKRLISNNGIKINNTKIEKDLSISEINFKSKNFFKLSIGKKKHFKIEII